MCEILNSGASVIVTQQLIRLLFLFMITHFLNCVGKNVKCGLVTDNKCI